MDVTLASSFTEDHVHMHMCPSFLPQVFMLSTEDRLDEATLRSILESGHSRIPVHEQGKKSNILG